MAVGVNEALYVRGIMAFLMPGLESMSISVYEDNMLCRSGLGMGM